MYVDFNSLPDTARVWIYQSHRGLKPEEVTRIDSILKEFVGSWKRHGEDLKASFQVSYDQFIVLAVDESHNDVSGCSIDASVNVIKHLENELQIDLLNKMNVSFKDGENINTVSLKEFKDYARQQKINANTVVFNNLVTSKREFESSWEVEAGKSWHAKYL